MWTGRVINIKERYEVKVNELRKVTRKSEYEEKLKQRWERVRGELKERMICLYGGGQGVRKIWRSLGE